MWVCRPLSTSLCLALARTHFPSPSLSLSPSLTHTHSLSLINAIGVFVRRGKLRKLGPQTPAESPAHTPHRSARSCVLTVVAVLGSRMSEPVFFQTLGRLALLCFSSQPQHKYSARTHIPPPLTCSFCPICASAVCPSVCPSRTCASIGRGLHHGAAPFTAPTFRTGGSLRSDHGRAAKPSEYTFSHVCTCGIACVLWGSLGDPKKERGGEEACVSLCEVAWVFG